MTKTKRQLRAEAVERLKNMGEWCDGIETAADFMKALLWNLRVIDSKHIRAALIDLLTDDEPQEGADSCEQVTDGFMKNVRMEGRTLIIDGVEFADTREKLEADVREWIDIATYKAFTPERMLEVMLHWLNRQAAITEREYDAACKACEDDQDSMVAQMAEESADLQAQLDEVSRAYKERGRIIEELREKYINLLEYRTKVDCDCDCCNWQEERDRMQKVIETQAESFRKLEAELSSMVKKYEEQKRRLSDKQQENANQRDELARFNSASKRTKRMPKACVWPRNDDGKLLKPGRDCYCITFFRCGYRVEYANDEDIWNEYRDAREIERAWQRGED